MIQGLECNKVESFIDDRGFLSQILPEGDKSFEIKRIYSTGNFSKKMVKVLDKLDKEICSPKIWWDHPKIRSSKSISQYKTKWKNQLIPDEIF